MIISAPGKILLLGGFAVLDYYPALSIAMADGKGLGACADIGEAKDHHLVSKQFGIDRKIDEGNLYSEIKESPANERIAVSAYACALSYLKETGAGPKKFSVNLDNSQIFGGKNEKSGLGSSAASTVALIAGLFEANSLPISQNIEKIHKLAQISHSIATEKVGSGFDIATSCFGSIEYVRYEKDTIRPEGMKEFGGFLADSVNSRWKMMDIKPFSLESFELVAFNIKGAKTSTVSSVKAVRKLTEYTPELYQNKIREQSEAEGEVMEAMRKKDKEGIREGMHRARKAQVGLSGWVYRLGMMAFDPIEPPQLGRIIDEAEKLDGIIAGRCPGSGGFDSVVFLAENPKIDQIVKIGSKEGLKLEHIEAKISNVGVRKV